MMIKPLSSHWRILMVWNLLDIWREKGENLLFFVIQHLVQHLDMIFVFLIHAMTLWVLFVMMVHKDTNAILNISVHYLWILMNLMTLIILECRIMKCLLMNDLFKDSFVMIKTYSIRTSFSWTFHNILRNTIDKKSHSWTAFIINSYIKTLPC